MFGPSSPNRRCRSVSSILRSGLLAVREEAHGVRGLLNREVPVSFGFSVVLEVVVDPGPHLVSLAVVVGMQWNRSVHVFQGSLAVRRGQECVSDGTVPVAHLVGRVEFYCSGGDVNGFLLVLWIGGGLGVCSAAPVGRVIERDLDRGGVVLGGVLVVTAV